VTAGWWLGCKSGWGKGSGMLHSQGSILAVCEIWHMGLPINKGYK